MESDFKWIWGFIWGDENVLGFNVVMIAQFCNILKTTELCFKRITLYLSYISIRIIYIYM